MSEIDPVMAEEGKQYPIRCIELVNGMVLIGYVIEIDDKVIQLYRPFVVFPTDDVDPDGVEPPNMVQYELIPYQSQIAHFDITNLTPIPFMLSATVSVFYPASHLLLNYQQYIGLQVLVATEDDEDDEDNEVTIH